MEPQAFWIESLRKYRTLDELKRSEFFAGCGGQIESYLRTPQVFENIAAGPLLKSFLRVAQWNIEKGKCFSSILHHLQNNEFLKWADVIVLNEADRGMLRSGNRHVAFELAKALGMQAVFGPAHFELTKGTGEELCLEGENRESLQGNAVLSRYPISEARIVPLPVSFEPYEFYEKRFGPRNCVWARLEMAGPPVWIGAVHLELRNTPNCRARQIRHILGHLPGEGRERYILCGDLNTNGFSRGTAWRTLNSVLRLLIGAPNRLKSELLQPDSRAEPLFKCLTRAGFEWKRMNSNEETARTAIDTLEETGLLPVSVLTLVMKRLEPYEGYLCMKLDWLLGKNIRTLSGGEKQDSGTGVIATSPGTVKVVNSGRDRVSDHLPIYADFDLA